MAQCIEQLGFGFLRGKQIRADRVRALSLPGADQRASRAPISVEVRLVQGARAETVLPEVTTAAVASGEVL